MASIKIKDFFNGRFFEIPKYQRGYSWELQNIRDLFDDIIESVNSSSNHYIGTIVLSKSEDDDEKFYIVDGQQRITTIMLIINSLVKSLDNRDLQYYERFYLKEGNRFRLTPLNRDKDFFINLFKNNKPLSTPQNKSQRFLMNAAEEISFKINSIEDKLKFLKSVEKLEIMEFVENSEGDAIRIFQTVNDRGKPLSSMEKAKSLLIYFSNRYLKKKLDSVINDYFSDMFEVYDDIKHIGENLGINLIKSREFNEDNLLRYHFVTYSNEDYDPTSKYVLQFLKSGLTELRNCEERKDQIGDYNAIETFILSYINSLKSFFNCCKTIVTKAETDPKYYKLFAILNLSATLYPLVIKLEERGILEVSLPDKTLRNYTFFDLIELIEVRVYKTRGTDPKADMAKFVYEFDNKDTNSIQDWLVWFNQRWMSKEEFKSNLYGAVYGNRALNHIFISHCEDLRQKTFSIDELKSIVDSSPTIEHVLSQTPMFAPKSLGFKNKEDFIELEGTLGNLTIIEKSLNSRAQNKSAIEKVTVYGESRFIMTKQLGSEIDTSKYFKKNEIKDRTQYLADFCNTRWWC